MPSLEVESTRRPTAMKRHSSQSSYTSQTPRSPHDHPAPAPRSHVTGKRHARVVLPRNHSSARNLHKMGCGTKPVYQQAPHAKDTEIRLPGSLGNDGASADTRATTNLRRNFTESRLPRNNSQIKLRKNHSHGALMRLGSTKVDLHKLTQKTPPLSPGLKEKQKKRKSADLDLAEQLKDLNPMEQDMANAVALKSPRAQQQASQKKVGFAVGSPSGDEDVQDMEGPGLEEGEWTEGSASASPYNTRNNTAPSSRKNSVLLQKPPLMLRKLQPDQSESSATHDAEIAHRDVHKLVSGAPEKHTPAVVEPPKRSVPVAEKPPDAREQPAIAGSSPPSPKTSVRSGIASSIRSQSYTPDPIMRRLLNRSSELKPEVSSISANASHLVKRHDDTYDADDKLETAEIISRFNKAHPSTTQLQAAVISNQLNRVDTNHITPQSSFNRSSTAELTPSTRNNSSASSPHNHKSASFAVPNHSIFPGGTSYSSNPMSTRPSVNTTTPHGGQRPSRTEMKLMLERGQSALEELAEHRPMVPAHVYDRRNVSLKSYVHLAGFPGGCGWMEREMFEGRYKAADREYPKVRKYRDPVRESVQRLEKAKWSKLYRDHHSKTHAPAAAKAAAMRTSKSTIVLPVRQPSKLITSISPPKHAPHPATGNAPAGAASISPPKSAMSGSGGRPGKSVKRGVSFGGTDIQEFERQDQEREPEIGSVEEREIAGIVESMWEDLSR